MPTESWAASEAVRNSMRGNRSRDTIPELRIRSALHALGFRFRVHSRPVASIARRADVVLRGARIAVFIDGCFWHGCPEHYRPPATNQAYWHPKIDANRRRDHDTDERLRAAAWTPLRIWEHEPVPEAINRIQAHVTRGVRSGIRTSEDDPMPADKSLPGTLKRSPKKAQETWLKTHDSAVEQYGEGEQAHRTAFKSLKNSFEKVDDHWERKDEKGPSDPRSKNRGKAARDGRGEALGGVDYYGHTKAELYVRAKDLGVEGRSTMTKLELARAIGRKQR